MGRTYEDVLFDGGYAELTAADFYQELFSYTDGYLRYRDALQLPVTLSGENGGTWRSVALRDLEEFCCDRNDAYVSPCTYFPTKGKDGRWRASNTKERADQLVAFVLDLDKGSPGSLSAALDEWWPNGDIPTPTYAVCSGNGLHLYYVLDQPVSLRKRWLRELAAINAFLYDLYRDPRPERDYEGWEVSLGTIDRHGLTQPYRVVGTLSKDETHIVTAWRVGETWALRDLAWLADLPQRDFTEDEFDMGKSLLSQSIARNAEYKAEREAAGKVSGKGWNPGFYRWLAARERERSRLYGEYGHRYNQVVALSIAARKDRIPRAQLESDIKALHEGWNKCARKYGHPEIGWSECVKAMRIYDQKGDVHKFPKWWLEEKCGFEFGTQKRRGRSQEEHLAFARKMKTFYPEIGEAWRLGGRPTKEAQIKAYAAEHPEANHSEIARALGVSRPTVIKWLK